MSGRWRGWGGVATMAAACALAVTGALVPLGCGSGDGDRDGGTGPVATGPQAPLEKAQYAWAQDDTTDNCDASLSPSSGTLDGDAVRRITNRGLLRVGVDQNSYLWGFRDPASGQLSGFDIDIVKAIAKDLLGDSSKVQYLTVPTDQRIPMIQQGKVDMVVRTMTINCDRVNNKHVAFSTAYFHAGQQILAARNSPITGYDESLRGKTVCTAKGSTGETKLVEPPQGSGQSDAQRLGIKVLAVPNQLDCLVRLQLGLADAVFTDNALAAGQAAQDPSVHLVGQPVTQEPYGVAMSDRDPDLVRRVNQVLAAYEAGGTGSSWMRSYDHWLAKGLGKTGGPPEPKYK